MVMAEWRGAGDGTERVASACILVLGALVFLTGVTGCGTSLTDFFEQFFNGTPVADAGTDINTTTGSKVNLDGYASSDPDGDSLSYTWAQVDGPQTVQINQAAAVEASAILPVEGVYEFSLTVSDGRGGSDTDTKRVSVSGFGANNWPVARAGNDQAVAPGTAVTLDGSGSYDEDADPLTYLWFQTGGPDVTLTCHNCAKAEFTAPNVSADTVLTFNLKVNDGRGGSATDAVNITVAGPDKYTLTVSVEGDGAVLLDPPGGSYDPDTVVTLDPVPSSGWQFARWEGDQAGSSDPATIEMDGHKSVRAVFEEISSQTTYALTIDANSCCTVQLDPEGGVYEAGTQVTIAVVPDTCYTFDHWEGGLSGSTNPATITMDGDKLVKPVCTEAGPFTLTTTMSGEGTVFIDPNEDTYACGTEVLLTAIPAEGWQFEKWQGDLTGSTNPTTVTMDANMSITAVFMADAMPDPNDPNIRSSEWRAGVIEYVGNEDAWTFTAQAGDLVFVQINRTSGALNPILDLFPPSGGPKEASAGGSTWDDHAIAQLFEHPIAESGRYTVVVRDQGTNETGGYVLSLLILSGPLTSPQDPDGGPIEFEEVKTGAIDPVADQDAYTFTGVAGQKVSIQVTRTDGALNPRIYLYPPGGSTWETYAGRSTWDDHSIAHLYAYPLAESGQYTILVVDQGENEIGDYLMSLQVLP